MAALVQTRVTVLSEVVPMVDCLFLPEPPIDEAAWVKTLTAQARPVLAAALAAYQTVPWRADDLKPRWRRSGPSTV